MAAPAPRRALRLVQDFGPARKAAALLLSFMAFAVPTCAGAAEGTLTLAEALQMARQRSQQLVAQDASIESARQMAVAAGQLPDPQLRLSIDNLPIEGADRFSVNRDFMTMRRIGVMQEFTGEEKRRLRAARFDREADRGAAEWQAALAAIQRDTAIAWLDAFHLQRLRAAVAEQARETRFEIEASEGAYRAGRGSQADVLGAHSSRVMLEDRLSELDRRIRSARAMLARWTGEKAAGATLAGEPALDTVPFDAETLEEHVQGHPNIAVMNQEIAMSEAEVALARANKRPDWTWELMYQKRGPDFSDMVGISVSIPLQWDQRNRQDREVAAKLAMTEKARAQREEALRQRVAEVRTMLNEWHNGRERLERYRRELVPLARNRTAAVVSAYRGGKGDLTAVLTARRNELEVHAQSLQLETDLSRVWAQLRFLYPDDAASSAVSSPTKPSSPSDWRHAQ